MSCLSCSRKVIQSLNVMASSPVAPSGGTGTIYQILEKIIKKMDRNKKLEISDIERAALDAYWKELTSRGSLEETIGNCDADLLCLLAYYGYLDEFPKYHRVWYLKRENGESVVDWAIIGYGKYAHSDFVMVLEPRGDEDNDDGIGSYYDYYIYRGNW